MDNIQSSTVHENSGIEVIARALIRRNDEILFARGKGFDYYYLPGGHVEFPETAIPALKREIKEELGVEVTEEPKYIGTIENIFSTKTITHHEINLLFETSLPGEDIVSKEDRLEFEWLKINDLNTLFILPKPLKQNLLEYFENGQPFWAVEDETNKP